MRHLQREIDQLKRKLLGLGAVVEENMRLAIHAIETRDVAEARKVIVAAPGAGRILDVTAPHAGVEVEKGSDLVTLFSQDLAQKRRYYSSGVNEQLGLRTEPVPAALKVEPFPSRLIAPLSGIVTERAVSVGQYVAEGEKLMTIVDPSVLWFRFDVYETQLPWLRVGQQIEVTVRGLPGRTFPAVVAFIDPSVGDATRTVKVRADVPNPLVKVGGTPQRLLKFGEYAEGRIICEAPDVLSVPRAAVLYPGDAAYAYVEKAPGVYERRRIRVGRQGDARWETLEGLDEGDRVVCNGNVLIDGQAQIEGGAQTVEAAAGARDVPAGEPAPTPLAVPASAAQTRSTLMTTGASTPAPITKPIIVYEPRDKAAGAPDAKAAAVDTPRDKATDATAGRPLTRRESTLAISAASEEMRAVRWKAMADAAERDKETVDGGAPKGTPPPDVITRPAVESTRAARLQAMIDAAKHGGHTPTADPAAEPATPPAAEATPAASESAATPAAVPQTMTHSQGDAVRRSVSADMRETRTAAMAEGQAAQQPPADPADAESARRPAAGRFVVAANAVAQALAADDLAQYNRAASGLPDAVAELRTRFGGDARWSAAVERIAAAGALPQARDLKEARAAFLAFATAAAGWAKALKKEAPGMARVKIYHCPMAPEPGLWIQTSAPLRNPYFGAEMLTCGEEVRP